MKEEATVRVPAEMRLWGVRERIAGRGGWCQVFFSFLCMWGGVKVWEVEPHRMCFCWCCCCCCCWWWWCFCGGCGGCGRGGGGGGGGGSGGGGGRGGIFRNHSKMNGSF